MQKFRIVSDRVLGKDTKVYHVDDDGKQTKIGGSIFHIDISMDANDINRAKIIMEAFVEVDVLTTGEVTEK